MSEDLSDAVIPFFHVLDAKGEYVFLTFPHDWPAEQGRRAGRYEAVCHIPAHFLNDGSYFVTVQVNTVNDGHTLEFFERPRAAVRDRRQMSNKNPHRAHAKYSYRASGFGAPAARLAADAG